MALLAHYNAWLWPMATSYYDLPTHQQYDLHGYHNTSLAYQPWGLGHASLYGL
jgi:hypothetical protein